MESCVSSDHWFVVPTAQWDQNAQSLGENLVHITSHVFVTVAPSGWVGSDVRHKLHEQELYICVWCILYVLRPVYIHRDPMPRMVFDWAFERPYLIVYLVQNVIFSPAGYSILMFIFALFD